MQKKNKHKDSHYLDEKEMERRYKDAGDLFYYGNLDRLHLYKEPHPAVMQDWIKKFDWADQLHPNYKPQKYKLNNHEKVKYRVFTFIEQKLLGGRQLGGFKNYRLIKGK